MELAPVERQPGLAGFPLAWQLELEDYDGCQNQLWVLGDVLMPHLLGFCLLTSLQGCQR
jgi:hypothetical protein